MEIKKNIENDIYLPDQFLLNIENISIKNQGKVQSCSAYAISSILEFHKNNNQILSTNFIYGFAEDDNPGMQLTEACDIIIKYDDCEIDKCPGNYEKPKAHEYFKQYIHKEDLIEKTTNTIQTYYICHDYETIKYSIYTYGPVVAVLNWPKSYKIDKNGNFKFNKRSLKQQYHTIVIYGWDISGFWGLNSLGKEWGKNGCFHFNYNDDLIKEAIILIPNKIDIDVNKYENNI